MVVFVYIQDTLKFININLQKHCKEPDIEITAVQLDLIEKKVIIFSGNFDYFLNTLDNIFNSLHKHKPEFIIFGDININNLDTNNK